MDATTLGDLLENRAAADDDRDDPAEALYAPDEPERRYSASRLLTDARKSGNFLRQLGVGPGHEVAIADRPTPESILSLFGTALLGGVVWYVSLGSGDETDSETSARIDARVLIGPTDRLEGTATTAVTKRLGYGRAPENPGTAYFEREVWSENPAFPPSDVAGDAIAIETSSEDYTHREVLAAAERIVEMEGFDPGTEIAVRAPLSDPRTVVAGILAPVACEGTILFPGSGTEGDLAVIAGDKRAPEPSTIDVADVSLADQ